MGTLRPCIFGGRGVRWRLAVRSCSRSWWMTRHRQPRLKVSVQSVKRFKGNLKALFRRGRGRSLSETIAQAMPVLRGWIHYFRLAETKGVSSLSPQALSFLLR